MPRRRLRKPKESGPLKEIHHSNVLQTNKGPTPKSLNQDHKTEIQTHVQETEPIVDLKSILDDEDCLPCSSSSLVNNLSTDAAALYDELDTFRQRWKRELEVIKPLEQPGISKIQSSNHNRTIAEKIERLNIVDNEKSTNDLSSPTSSCVGIKQSLGNSDKTNESDQLYTKAKKLFLMAVELEQDEMHHESIRYYKQAMRLYPDIEKQIFKEQCEASAKASVTMDDKSRLHSEKSHQVAKASGEEKIQLYERILKLFDEDNDTRGFTYCRPASKLKAGTLHLSDLPIELILQIFRYTIGDDLDLASLESIGLVCRGFYILSKDPSIWRSICYSAWGSETLGTFSKLDNRESMDNVDWRIMFLDRPRVNYDGVYISRTRYLRQGDVGFQDITYRPFHVIRYYRYLRFFPDRRVLILVTNEEPDKIVPIFRHALHSKQFSSELSIMEGTYEFTGINQINIVADKNCRIAVSASSHNQRRQAQFHWSRQTPLSQTFNYKFELKTVENRPYRNNTLKWLNYTILTTLETGQEITSFDLSPESFPNLLFSRVKRFNLRLTNPLPLTI